MKPVIFGCSGTALTVEERAFFARANPFGYILFQRNVESPEQIRWLIADLRAALGREDAPIFIDQEGGRAVRLKPPHWPTLPPMREIGRIFEQDRKRGIEAMRLHARITARMLFELGITCNLAPVLDLFIEDADRVIGDRALSDDPEAVDILGREAMTAYLANGVLPCIKHLPGHGRVKVDPHHVETVIDEPFDVLKAKDFAPFIALKDAPLGMNSHAIFKAIDPDTPVSLSSKIHEEIIRRFIGFEGLLLSDDMAMKAFDDPKYGSLGQAALRALEAGTDIALYCSGKLPEMREVAAALPEISDAVLERWEEAKAMLREPEEGFNEKGEMACLHELIC